MLTIYLLNVRRDESRALTPLQTGYVTSGQFLAVCATVPPFVKQEGEPDSHKCSSQLWMQVPAALVAPPFPNPKWKEGNGSHERMQKWLLLVGVQGDEHKDCCLNYEVILVGLRLSLHGC